MTEQAPTPSGNGEIVAGRYELINLIGRGGHGLVWRARDRQSGSEVAVKMLTDVAAKDPGQVERLKREQQAMVALAGTNAVNVFDLCQSASGKLCLVMELLEGRDLEERLEELELRNERIPLPELIAALEPVITTLERAHQAGIVHRDLKPANIYLTPNGVRLLDFGLARLRSALPLTAAGTIVGSPSYIAPEAWKGRSGGLDQRVDVYSLGVLVFRALTARLPFEGRTLQEKFQLATSAERPSLHHLRPDLPREIDEWVEQVLAIDPNLRFNSVRGAWNALLGSLGLGGATAELVSHEDLAAVRTSASPLSSEPAPSSPREDSVTHAAASGIRRGLGMAFRRAKDALERWTRAPRPWEEMEPSGGFSPAPPPVASTPPAAKQEQSFAREWLASSDYQKPAVVIAPVVAVIGTKGPPDPLPEPAPNPNPEAGSAERLHTQRLREPSEVIPADIAAAATEVSAEPAEAPQAKKRGGKKTKPDADKPAKAKKQKAKSKSRRKKKK